MHRTSLSSFAIHILNGLLVNYPLNGIEDQEIINKAWNMAQLMYDKQEEIINKQKEVIKTSPAYIQEREQMLAMLLNQVPMDSEFLQRDIAQKLNMTRTGRRFRAVWELAISNQLIKQNPKTKKYYQAL